MCRKSSDPNMQVVFVDSQAGSASVKKITAKGVELEYVPGARPLGKEVTVDIFQWGESPVAVPGVSCRNVCDCLVLTENRTFSGATVRHCTLEYVDLTPKQRKKLEIMTELRRNRG